MEQVKRIIRCNCLGKKIVDQFHMDDDVNVPDAKHDVQRIIISQGELKVEEIKIVESYAKISGKIVYQILYATEGAEQKMDSLQGKLSFEEMVYVDEVPEGQLYLIAHTVEVTPTIIHSRKINMKIMVEMELNSDKMKEEEVTLDMEDVKPLYKKYKSKELLKLHTSKKDTYRIKEELGIPGTKENIGTLLWSEAASRKLDTRMGTDELLLRGELQIFCFYESLEGKLDWVEQVIPYEGRIECQGAQEGMFHHLYAELADENIEARMDEDGEMRIVGVEATLEIRLAVYEEEKMDILEDVYSLEQVCVPQIDKMSFESLVMQNHSKCKVTEQLVLPELKDEILQICHSSGYLQTEHTEITEAGILVEGILNVCFLYVRSDDTVPFDIWQGMVPFSHTIESNEVTPDMKYDIVSSLEQLSVGLLGSGEMEVKAILSFNNFLRKPILVENISDLQMQPIDMEQMEKTPGIIGYVVKEQEDLWDLAKKYSTTKEGIMEVNNMTQEELKPGDKILIFKENMSIL